MSLASLPYFEDHPAGPHLSASSLNLFARCPRQWQEKYIYRAEAPLSDPLMIGKYAHLLIEHSLSGMIPEPDIFPKLCLQDGFQPGEKVQELGEAAAYHYYESVGKWLDVVGVEQEVILEIPGVDIPILGYIDVECRDRIIDVKTTGYLSPKSVRINSEWKLQANIYQLYKEVPAEFHVITRAKTNPVLVPSDPSHFLYVSPPPRRETEQWIRQTYDVMKFYYERWGTDEYPGGRTHDWAGRYCSVPNCCQL